MSFQSHLATGLLMYLALSIPCFAAPVIVVPGNLVQNSSFENPDTPPGTSVAAVPFWVGGSGTVDNSLNDFGAFGVNSGEQYAARSGIAGDIFSQTIVGTVAGQFYDIVFYTNSSRPDPLVTFGGASLVGTGVVSPFNSNWLQFTFNNILAPSNNSILAFSLPSATQIEIDDVSVVAQAVPELDSSCFPLPLIFTAGLLAISLRRGAASERRILGSG